jgi:protein-tyrosine-phosphatase
MMRTIALAVLLVGAAVLPSWAADGPLSLVKAIELPRVEGRIDHLAFDPATQRLYVAALGNNTVEVLDVKAGTHLRSLPGFREPQGIAVAADAKIIAVANGQGDGVQFLSAEENRSGAVVKLGDDSDNVRYDAVEKRLYVGFGSGALAAVDPAIAKLLGQVKLAGHPESFQLERSGPRVFVNVPTADQIAVVDRAAMKVIATWPVTSARSNFPMALDEANHRLFVGCRRPAKVLVFDTTTGKETASFDIVGDTDDLFYDASRKRVYVSGGEGFVDVVEDRGGNRFERIAHLATAAGARTSLFVADQNRLFLAVPHRGNQKAEIRIFAVAGGRQAAASEPSVVFVCEHGAAKSVIATAYFNKIAAQRGLKARATYRGVNPQADLSVSAMKGLKEDGLTVEERKPALVSQSDVDTASLIFAIGCTLPSNATASGKTGTWDDVPDDQGYGPMRDAIKRHVEELVDRLLKQQR